MRARRAQARLCGRDARAPRDALTYRARKRPNLVRRLLDSRFRGNDGVKSGNDGVESGNDGVSERE